MKLKKYKKYLFLLPIVTCIIVIGFVSPDSITAQIGTQNTYVIMFIIALIGGLSIFSAIPWPLFLITFSLGGANPTLLAMCTTLGVILGDSTSYIVGRKGNTIIEGKWKDLFDSLLSFYNTKSKYLMGIFFLYGVISPFPNDLITLSAGIKKYNYFKMIIPLSLGNLIFCLMLAHFAEFFAPYF